MSFKAGDTVYLVQKGRVKETKIVKITPSGGYRLGTGDLMYSDSAFVSSYPWQLIEGAACRRYLLDCEIKAIIMADKQQTGFKSYIEQLELIYSSLPDYS